MCKRTPRDFRARNVTEFWQDSCATKAPLVLRYMLPWRFVVQSLGNQHINSLQRYPWIISRQCSSQSVQISVRSEIIRNPHKIMCIQYLNAAKLWADKSLRCNAQASFRDLLQGLRRITPTQRVRREKVIDRWYISQKRARSAGNSVQFLSS